MKTDAHPTSGAKLVSIGVPIYKRLEYLPGIFKMVGLQDYPAIELIISDNGENGSKVRDLVSSQYARPYRFRQNPATVDVVLHHNQIIEAAQGEYFFLLSDDDEISFNFVSELVKLLDANPDAALAYAKLEMIDKAGGVLTSSSLDVPPKLSGAEFIRAIWKTYEYGFENVEGFLTRTKLWQDAGGYPKFTKGNHVDNAAVIRLCLTGHVVLTSRCTYRHRVHPESLGKAVSMKELAAASKDFLEWLEHEPALKAFADGHANEWVELKKILQEMTWETYLWRWQHLYRPRLSAMRWAREAFRLPYIPAYYERVSSILKQRMKARAKRLFAGRGGAGTKIVERARKIDGSSANSR